VISKRDRKILAGAIKEQIHHQKISSTRNLHQLSKNACRIHQDEVEAAKDFQPRNTHYTTVILNRKDILLTNDDQI
jgi:hypothetical protein